VAKPESSKKRELLLTEDGLNHSFKPKVKKIRLFGALDLFSVHFLDERSFRPIFNALVKQSTRLLRDSRF